MIKHKYFKLIHEKFFNGNGTEVIKPYKLKTDKYRYRPKSFCHRAKLIPEIYDWDFKLNLKQEF